MDENHEVLVIPCVVESLECVIVVAVDDEAMGFLLPPLVLTDDDAVGTGLSVVSRVIVLPGNSIRLINIH